MVYEVMTGNCQITDRWPLFLVYIHAGIIIIVAVHNYCGSSYMAASALAFLMMCSVVAHGVVESNTITQTPHVLDLQVETENNSGETPL